eukprot:TRINITY_DN3411_c0_g1_i1.p1 TRINITY_DN3411_c0_g1~~TRINITY_DN3411_c0_g1_i1.p1  ORF type:complete len:131 (+),score=30.76 TRINITY_DN3411_c0_g1_i1:55-393(+)
MTEVFFKVKTIIAENAIVIFSKSYCPYCQRIKAFLRELKHEAAVFELDLLPDGSQMQDVLLKMTGQRTVPNILSVNSTLEDMTPPCNCTAMESLFLYFAKPRQAGRALRTKT